ncbi:MAG: hypothetical protein ACI857_000123 [Arenicella sp.]|jgi:hypothetical protein
MFVIPLYKRHALNLMNQLLNFVQTLDAIRMPKVEPRYENNFCLCLSHLFKKGYYWSYRLTDGIKEIIYKNKN